MKRLQLLTICLVLSALSFGQNQSSGGIDPSISPVPTLPALISGEVFRFDQGLVTQLDDFTPPSGPMDPLFSFDDSRWFSIGRLDTGSQEVYGLRFQLPNRALTYGYQDIDDDNPRIQWIDDRDNPGNLEFRVADDFMSTNSTLVATMTNNGRTRFGSPFFFAPNSRVQVTNDINGEDVSLYAEAFNVNQGIGIQGRSLQNNSNIGVQGSAASNVTVNNFAYAIRGSATQNSNGNSFAGFFDGDVNITGTLTAGSDRKLKEDLNESEKVLNKISQLKAYTYTFRDNPDLNLPLGPQHGLIAQEVEKVYPELVKEIVYPIYNDKQELQGTDTYKSVNYLGLISELTAAVNELNQKVEDLKASKTTLVYSSQFTEEELAKIRANGYQLEQNIPNPFSGVTTIQYSLPENSPQASIMIFDLSGKLIQSYKLKERNGQLRVNQSDLGESGMYLYSLFAGGKEIMTKRMLVK